MAHDNSATAAQFVKQANLIKQIYLPVFMQSAIEGLSFIEIEPNGHFTYLSSDAEHLRRVTSADDFYLTGLELLQRYQQEGVYLSDLNQVSPVENFGTALHDLAEMHALQFVERSTVQGHPVIRVYTFFASADPNDANTFYLNNLEGLRFMNTVFYKRLKSFIEKTARIIPGHDIMTQSEQAFTTLYQRNPVRLLDLSDYKDKLDSYVFNENARMLTRRERQVIELYLEGKSAIETAEKLGLSARTVERHFENMRKKFNVKNKRSILVKLCGEGVMTTVA